MEREFIFTEEDGWFEGHFPGFPILPGVTQLVLMRDFARKVFVDFPETVTIRHLKFQKTILPNRPVRLVVERKGDAEFRFTYYDGDDVCSTGIVARSEVGE